MDQKLKISFCIITNGGKKEELSLCLNSIHSNFTEQDSYEIVVVGNNVDIEPNKNIIFVEDNEFIKFLGKRKNIATANSSGDILVHCDDDMLFPPDWYFKFKKYYESNKEWEILGHRILIPDGDRCYDRVIYLPRHRMVPYDFDENADPHTLLYQTGAFSICKKSLLEKIEWSNEIPYYGKLNGFEYNEDVDFSVKLKNAGVKIHFDIENVVWHNDYSYFYKDWFLYKKSPEDKSENKCFDFIMLLNKLKK